MHPQIARSLQTFPGGSNGEFDLPADLSTVIQRGKGSRLWTVEGRELLDFSMGWGSALPGHAADEVVEAVQTAAAAGCNFSYVTEASLALAEELLRLSPACEQVRFCASGTEATMYALRLARAATGRSKIVKFEGAYHGAHDVGVSSLFPSAGPAFPTSQPSSAGVDLAAQGNLLIAPFNNLAYVERLIWENRSDLACVIVEPLQRCVPPAPGFLTGLRAACNAAGVLLAFDEVVTGFRLAYGGAQDYYGVTPDIVAYGKALGGGLPIGAFGADREIMALATESRLGSPRDPYVWTASTLGGNPVSSSAALAALAIYRRSGAYEQLHSLGDYLRCGVGRVLENHGLTAQILGDGPLASFVLTDRPAIDYRTTRHEHPRLARRIMLELFARGVFLNPMGTKLYLSLAHTRSDCDELCNRLDDAVASATRQTDSAKVAAPAAAS